MLIHKHTQADEEEAQVISLGINKVIARGLSSNSIYHALYKIDLSVHTIIKKKKTTKQNPFMLTNYFNYPKLPI